MKLHSMKRLSNYPARERGISQTHYTLYTTRRRGAVAQKRVTEWHRFARAPGSSVAAVFLTHFSEEGGVEEKLGPRSRDFILTKALAVAPTTDQGHNINLISLELY